jgi:hypothetical protein
MADITKSIGELITCDATDQGVTLNPPVNGNVTFFIKVVSGSVKVGVNAVPATAYPFATTDTVPPITCLNGQLHVKSTANTDTIVITVA